MDAYNDHHTKPLFGVKKNRANNSIKQVKKDPKTCVPCYKAYIPTKTTSEVLDLAPLKRLKD